MVKSSRRSVFSRHLSYLLLLVLSTGSIQCEKLLNSDDELYEGEEFKKAFHQPKDRADKPNVLLIGDSISIGYTVEVRKKLSQTADVFRVPSNAKATDFGLQNID